MIVAVWDAYVKKVDGRIMHFDIIVSSEIRDENIIKKYGKEYLQLKNMATAQLTSQECRFCHIGKASSEVELSIQHKGYYIVELENCN